MFPDREPRRRRPNRDTRAHNRATLLIDSVPVRFDDEPVDVPTRGDLLDLARRMPLAIGQILILPYGLDNVPGRGMVVMVGLFTPRKDKEFYDEADAKAAIESAAASLSAWPIRSPPVR